MTRRMSRQQQKAMFAKMGQPTPQLAKEPRTQLARDWIDGELVDVRNWKFHVWCASCDEAIEEEAIAKGGKLYHYRCGGIEL